MESFLKIEGMDINPVCYLLSSCMLKVKLDFHIRLRQEVISSSSLIHHILKAVKK